MNANVNTYRKSLNASTYHAAKEHAAIYCCDGEPSAQIRAIMDLAKSTDEDDQAEAESMLLDLIEEDMSAE